MTSLTFAALRHANASRCLRWHKTGINEWSLADWIVAVGGEVGEALNVVKKLNRDRDGLPGNTKDRAALVVDLGDELADVVIYADIVRQILTPHEHIGSFYDLTDFVDLRQRTLANYPLPHIMSHSEWSIGLLEVAGNLANIGNAVDEYAGARGLEVDDILKSVDAIAWAFHIDLMSAVVRKFNATSEAYGFPERLSHG